MNRRVAVTGATGFIGRHVIARLIERGDDVRAVVRPSGSHRVLPPAVTIVPAPFEADALARAFRGTDAVIHLAAVISAVSASEYHAVNVVGTRAVADAARNAGARLVHISSLAAAGPAPASQPHSEDDPPAPVTPYGRSKLASERAIAEVDGLNWIVLRPGVVYGPGDRALLPLFAFAKRGILPLVGRPAAAYTLVHVADVVRAIEAGLAADVNRDILFVGHPVPVTARELLEEIRTAAGGKAAIIRVPAAVVHAAALVCEAGGTIRGRPMFLNRARARELYAPGFTCRVDRLRERLGVVAEIGLHDGVAQAAEWYRREA